MKKNNLTVVLVGMLIFGMLLSFSVAASELSGKLTIWSWGAGAEKEAREDAVEVFAKAHPELEIEHVVLPTADGVWDQKQAAAFAADNAADVMQMSPDYYGLMTEYYEDLNPYVERDGIDLDEVVTEGMMNGYYRPNGKLEALPLLANTFVFAYNKDMFDKFGIEYPTDDWTWEDFVEMAPKFVSGEGFNHTYFMVNHWVMPNFALLSMGGEPYTDDFTKTLLDSEEVADGLNTFSDLISSGAIPDAASSRNMPAEQLFVAGKAAIYSMGGFEIGSLTEQIGDTFEWDAVLPPVISKTGKNSNVTFATGYAMNKNAKNKEAAWQFLKEVSFANEDMARITATVGMPGNKKVADNFYADISYGNVPNLKFVEGLATSRLYPWGGAMATAGDQWTQMWESVTIGGVPAVEAQEKYVPIIEKAFIELNIEN